MGAEGFKPSKLPLAEQSAACLLLLALESMDLVMHVEGVGWVPAASTEESFQEYTDSDWLDHRIRD